jgi:hypothetical protein
MKAHWLTFTFLVAAVACYLSFISVGFVAFLVLGVVSETIFWLRTIRGIHRSPGKGTAVARVVRTEIFRG